MVPEVRASDQPLPQIRPSVGLRPTFETSLDDREVADAIQADVGEFLSGATAHLDDDAVARPDGDAHDTDGSFGSAIPVAFRRTTEKPTLQTAGIRKPSRPRRRRKRPHSWEWQERDRSSDGRARRRVRTSHHERDDDDDDDDDDDGDEGNTAVAEMIFNEWEKQIVNNGGDVLCIAEAFLLSQYSDFAYYGVEECIKTFAPKVKDGELPNPAGWLHMQLEKWRHAAEDEEGMQADHALRQKIDET